VDDALQKQKKKIQQKNGSVVYELPEHNGESERHDDEIDHAQCPVAEL